MSLSTEEPPKPEPLPKHVPSSIDREWDLEVEKENLRIRGANNGSNNHATESDSLLGNDDHPHHFSNRVGWLRAMVLGANDGLVSVGSVMLGVAGAAYINSGKIDNLTIVLSGISALVAGALSMGIGEFVSVHSQKDAEQTDIRREKRELLFNPQKEMEEIVRAYMKKGLSRDLAEQVANQLHETKEKALRAHLQEELNLNPDDMANPLQAAVVSALSFTIGGGSPLIAAGVAHSKEGQVAGIVSTCSIGFLFFGALGAHLGGSPMLKPSVRVLVGGLIAMAITFGVGVLFGATVG